MVLIVLGIGTLGAFPVVRVHGQVVEPAAAAKSGAPSGEATDVGSQVLADLGVESGSSLETDQTTYEHREAQFTTALPDQRAQVAIRTAMEQIGLPYVWGGDGPTNGDAGFDCSGLTTFSYAAAGVSLPRTAHTQYYTGPHVQQGAALQPGDLVFYGTAARVHHVGMYIGDGKMVNAPTFGKPVQAAFYRWNGDDYLGATRPAATGSTTGLLPYSPPAPVTPSQPDDFPAPVAPAPTTMPQATATQPTEVVVVTAAEVSAAAAATTPTTTVTVPPTTTSVATTSAKAAATTSSKTTSTTTSRATTTVAPSPVTTTSPTTTTSRTSATSSTITSTATTTTEATTKPAETATSSKDRAAPDSGDAQSNDPAASGSDGSG